MQRATVGVDIAAVRRSTDGHDVRAQRAKKFRPELVGRPIRAIQDHAKACEFCARDHAAAQKSEVFSIERRIGKKLRSTLRHWLATMLENIFLKLFFRSVRKLHPGMREELYAIILERIVRSGDDHSCLKIILANEACDTRSSYDPGKGDRRIRLRQPRSKKLGNVRTGFARVYADQDVRGAVFPLQIRGKRAARGMERRVVQRRRAGDAANAVGPKEFLSHQGCTDL